jgi:hypothetical protein
MNMYTFFLVNIPKYNRTPIYIISALYYMLFKYMGGGL